MRRVLQPVDDDVDEQPASSDNADLSFLPGFLRGSSEPSDPIMGGGGPALLPGSPEPDEASSPPDVRSSSVSGAAGSNEPNRQRRRTSQVSFVSMRGAVMAHPPTSNPTP
jgi:hypothetical protein